MVAGRQEEIAYEEVQRVKQLWIWILALVLIGLSWWAFIQQVLLGKPFGSNPAPDLVVVILLVVFGVCLPAFLLTLNLRVRVSQDEIQLRMFPIWSRTIPLDDVQECRARAYRPLLEYGGWGIRWMPGRGWVYSVSGKQGVQLSLASGKPLLIGSQRAERLAEAINSCRRQASSEG
jgi:hypothetical protein